MKASFIIINPYGEIDKAVANKDWFIGFANAVCYLEYFGTIRLREYIDLEVLSRIADENERRKVNEYLKVRFGRAYERLRADDIVFLLFAFGLIEADNFLKLRKVITTRNELVHPSRKGAGFRYAIPEAEAKEILTQAKECILNIQELRVQQKLDQSNR